MSQGALSKKELRAVALSRRDALPPAERAAFSTSIAAALKGMPEYARAHTVMLYVSFGSEVETWDLITAALAGGKQVTVPKVIKSEGALVPSLVKDPAKDLAPGAYGILEPRYDALRPVRPSSLDLILVPGVAFDAGGRRIGYGGGYYDRFLPTVAATAVCVAAAYEAQVFPALPQDAFDHRVDYVVTEKRIIDCRGRAKV